MLKLLSPAKLNLFLHVTGRVTQAPFAGYHIIQSAIQFIELFDELSFEPLSRDTITLVDNTTISAQDNLIYRIALLLQNIALEQGKTVGVNIHLHKRIPIGAGIGGGSSNAACTFIALNYLWQLGLSLEAMCELALPLGTDILVFLWGTSAFVEGIGDILTPIDLPEPWYLVATPPVQVATAKIYQDPLLTRHTTEVKIAKFFPGLGHNDCEPVTCKHYPEVAAALDWLSQYGSARMSGTGASVFSHFESEDAARKVAQQAPTELQIHVVKGKNNSPLKDMGLI